MRILSLLIIIFCNLCFAEEISIQRELLPEIQQKNVREAKLNHFFKDLSEIKGRQNNCADDQHCIDNWQKLIKKVNVELQNEINRLNQSDLWRYGLTIETLIEFAPQFEEYQHKIKCDYHRDGFDAFRFIKIDTYDNVTSNANLICLTKGLSSNCEVIESNNLSIFNSKENIAFEISGNLSKKQYIDIFDSWMISKDRLAFVKSDDYLLEILYEGEYVWFYLANSACDAPSHWMKYSYIPENQENILMFDSQGVMNK